MARVINDFRGEWEVLSNFSLDGVFGCDTVEHWYQSMKTLLPQQRNQIRMAPSPGQAKRLGRTVDLRPDWERIKVRVMRVAIQEKFAPFSEPAEALHYTGTRRLVEGNTWHDNFWGNCLCAGCRERPGRNMLGRILMEQRRLLARI